MKIVTKTVADRPPKIRDGHASAGLSAVNALYTAARNEITPTAKRSSVDRSWTASASPM
jgi:hypothetical protein